MELADQRPQRFRELSRHPRFAGFVAVVRTLLKPAESVRAGLVGATIYYRAMTAKELLLQEAPRWSEDDAEIALRAVQQAHAGGSADEWGNLSKVHEVAFGETMRRLGEEERAAGQKPW
jgi:hypothetical protein